MATLCNQIWLFELEKAQLENFLSVPEVCLFLNKISYTPWPCKLRRRRDTSFWTKVDSVYELLDITRNVSYAEQHRWCPQIFVQIPHKNVVLVLGPSSCWPITWIKDWLIAPRSDPPIPHLPPSCWNPGSRRRPSIQASSDLINFWSTFSSQGDQVWRAPNSNMWQGSLRF